jgi:hypothetical protein
MNTDDSRLNYERARLLRLRNAENPPKELKKTLKGIR